MSGTPRAVRRREDRQFRSGRTPCGVGRRGSSQGTEPKRCVFVSGRILTGLPTPVAPSISRPRPRVRNTFQNPGRWATGATAGAVGDTCVAGPSPAPGARVYEVLRPWVERVHTRERQLGDEVPEVLPEDRRHLQELQGLLPCVDEERLVQTRERRDGLHRDARLHQSGGGWPRGQWRAAGPEWSVYSASTNYIRASHDS